MTIGQRGRGIWEKVKRKDFSLKTKNEIEEMFRFYIVEKDEFCAQLEINILNLILFNNPFIQEFLENQFYKSYVNFNYMLKKMYKEKKYTEAHRDRISKYLSNQQLFILYCLNNDTEKAISVISKDLNPSILVLLNLNQEILNKLHNIGVDISEYAIKYNFYMYLNKTNYEKLPKYFELCIKYDRRIIINDLIFEFQSKFNNDINLIEYLIKNNYFVSSRYIDNNSKHFDFMIKKSCEYNNEDTFCSILTHNFATIYDISEETIDFIYNSKKIKFIDIFILGYNKKLNDIIYFRNRVSLNPAIMKMIIRLSHYNILHYLDGQDIMKYNLDELYTSINNYTYKSVFLITYFRIISKSNSRQKYFNFNLIDFLVENSDYTRLIEICDLCLLNDTYIIDVLIEYLIKNTNTKIFDILSTYIEKYSIPLKNEFILQCKNSYTNEGIVKIFPFIE